MGGVFIYILRDPKLVEQAGTLGAKASAMNFEPNWVSYAGLLEQAIAVGGVLIFGFVASWIFGREYSEGTSKDLLALPVSRSQIIHAKFVLYFVWCSALVLSNLILGLITGLILELPIEGLSPAVMHLDHYFKSAFLTLITGTPVACMALWGRGYLAPLGFVALTLVFAQVIAAAGFGSYFPWSVPGIYSMGESVGPLRLDRFSFIILFLTGIAGYVATLIYWNRADQAK
jgi:ABC-2 type transport system permease protein